ncbi:c-type cytochrome [Alsobacter sp. SYSU M60028]|uniref:C-type cytochrome n=2 Tax=Alsobacter ponti TaxID=2962936 RepID=A0ABT1LIB6_9HYPH|nr:c-type cytochrome [Alsobacter ponti]MCP8940873.1 c-type cytochrome [Alsobacter ponti]
MLAVLACGAATAVFYGILEPSRARQAAVRLTGGDPDRAPELIRRYGCAGCHTVPGVRGADGRVGPPLGGIAGRAYFAGVAINSPANLVAWIVDPPSLSPRTAMPRTGIRADEARDVAAYLYTLQ